MCIKIRTLTTTILSTLIVYASFSCGKIKEFGGSSGEENAEVYEREWGKLHWRRSKLQNK